MSSNEIMPIGVFASAGAGLGVNLDNLVDLDVPTVQLHSPPPEKQTPEEAKNIRSRFDDAGIEITVIFCGYEGESYVDIQAVRETVGLVPEITRQKRVKKTKRIADFAMAAGVPAIGLHIGFISEDWDSPEFADVVGVARDLCDYCAERGLAMHLETGQETAETLLEFLKSVDRKNIAVNFDPANMILYGSGAPLEAVNKVGGYVRSVHCKDAVGSDNPGVEFGVETPLGEGEVDIEKFIATLANLGYEGPLTIEREIGGQQQIKDIEKAIKLLNSLKQKIVLP
ncbi:Fe-S cluster assembly protein HesB [candidate division MSBL1 archaeon SCGC-AAA382A20]|uniref:Fe-S cluster assembly protein HesB n=1 Tax=candidate division MSBL1 archaeon SCGC-AAA382A20 TaxID=1698280 RepID=A0A133VMD6_9EURY|nr:Fe-S cluster assembly protein HesB [candidate division MSBL1 archaeon SCGC-AAA382A20]